MMILKAIVSHFIQINSHSMQINFQLKSNSQICIFSTAIHTPGIDVNLTTSIPVPVAIQFKLYNILMPLLAIIIILINFIIVLSSGLILHRGEYISPMFLNHKRISLPMTSTALNICNYNHIFEQNPISCSKFDVIVMAIIGWFMEILYSRTTASSKYLHFSGKCGIVRLFHRSGVHLWSLLSGSQTEWDGVLY